MNMKKILLLLILITTLVITTGCVNKYDKCVEACMSTYPSYVDNPDYIGCKQGCIDKHL